jgi:hypothetical protein
MTFALKKRKTIKNSSPIYGRSVAVNSPMYSGADLCGESYIGIAYSGSG